MLDKIFLMSGIAATIVPILADRSRHRPGNLAPIQVISGIGAWALLLLNAVMLVVALKLGSLIVACASFATLATAVWLLLQPEGRTVASSEAARAIDALVGETQQILARAHRTGIERITAVVVSGAVPFLGVDVSRRGHVIVRVREDLLAWLERHRGPGGVGAPAVESLVRFMFLHELGHVLNGDHLTFRFVRSVLVAHAWWLAAATIGTTLMSWEVAGAIDALIVCACLAPPFLVQVILARRFLAQREEVADLRALQTLDPADAALLVTRSRRIGGPGPTILEKLMSDLLVQSSIGRPAVPFVATVVHWIWPDGGQVRERCELLATGEERRAQPIRWAAEMGVQCGLLSLACIAAADAAFGVWPQCTANASFSLVVAMGIICAMAATYCGMRVDPARVRLDDLRRLPVRRIVGMTYFLSFSVSALVLHALLSFSIAGGSVAHRTILFCVAASAIQVVIGSLAAAARVEGAPEGPARTLRHLVLRPGPAVVISTALTIGCTLLATWSLGLPLSVWPGVALFTFAGITLSIVATRSPSAIARRIPPIAMLHSPGDVYAIRIVWRELRFDRASMPAGHIGMTGVAAYVAMSLFFAFVAALAAEFFSRAAGNAVVFKNLLLMSGALVGLQILVPKTSADKTNPGDVEYIQMLERLLNAAQTSRLLEQDRLRAALALWVRSATALPHAVLPERDAVWKLESLLPLLRIARAVGATDLITLWRQRILECLRPLVSAGHVTVNGVRPSLGYSVLAAEVVSEAHLDPEIPMGRLLDSLTEQLESWLNGRQGASAEGVASACRLLADHGRPRPGADRIRKRSLLGVEALLSSPIVRESLSELVAYATLLENTAIQDQLRSIVRSRLWETLQLNPDNDIPLLVDSYLAAVSLGETDASLLAAAEHAIGRNSLRIADELMTVVRPG